MTNSEITDPVFREAVEAIDSGNIELLESIIINHPDLAARRLAIPGEGYFSKPYLLWFIADNPIRIDKLPTNIVDIAKLLVQFVKRADQDNFQYQLNYTLGLVATGSVPRDCGVQIELMDLLINEGAVVRNAIGALAHGNIGAAAHLLKKGAPLSLAVAVCLDMQNEIPVLFQKADEKERHVALVAAAFFGKKEMIAFLISNKVDVNGYPDSSSGFHSHATALHQAIFSGSLECVKLLVDAGADINAKDKIYEGNPLGWVMHMLSEANSEEMKEKYKVIELYLRSAIER